MAYHLLEFFSPKREKEAMPKKLRKYLRDYLSKIKKPVPQIQLPSSSKNWILSGCKHPRRTLSFAIDSKQEEPVKNDEAATLADVDRFLFENFRSLYLRDDDNHCHDKEGGRESQKSPRFTDPPSHLGNGRFFSLTDEAPTIILATSEEFRSSCSASTSTANDTASNSNKPCKNDASLPDEYIAVLTNSLNPCDDFRISMQEIVEEQLQNDGEVDWDFMEELLFCYLNVNEKKFYKYILNAFVDLVVVLRNRSGGGSARTQNIRVIRMAEKAGQR